MSVDPHTEIALPLKVEAPTLPPPKAPRARGIDVSSWNHPSGKPIDWHKVRAAGYTFVMVKVTQGDYYTNPYLTEDFHGAHAAGLIVGAYHYWVQGISNTEQAAYFGHALSGHTTELGCYLDWEPSEINQFEAKQHIEEFTAEGHKFRNPIGLYVGEWWYGQLKTTGLAIARLWLADWSNDPLPHGVTIVQREPGPVDGVAGDTDIDELLSIRGLNVPQPPKAAEVPFVGEHPTAAVIDEVAEGESSDGQPDADEASEPKP